MAGYTHAQKIGKGQVLDVAQFEAMAQYMCDTYVTYILTGKVWRGAPSMGQDTEDILKKILGYDDAKIAVLKEKKRI